MLAECVVGVMALIAATATAPGRLLRHQRHPGGLRQTGDAGGGLAVPLPGDRHGSERSHRRRRHLAVGMSYIFTKVPWFSNLASYFFQFVVMFEAVFILTAVDSGTRVSRYLIQDFFGEFYPPLKRIDWMPGAIGPACSPA
jgi:carbon starvation protein